MLLGSDAINEPALLLDYTEIKSVVPARNVGHFTATPRRASPLHHFTIANGFPRLAGDVALLVIADLLVDNCSEWVSDEAVPAELFSELAKPVRLTLPPIGCNGRIELVLLNPSPSPACVVVRFFWENPQMGSDGK